jgi:uncharacterized protein (TIRG00374 family)
MLDKRRGAFKVGLDRRRIKAVAIGGAILGLVVAAVVAVRRMDFTFLGGLDAKSLLYLVPLFLVYQVGGIAAYRLVLRDAGYRVGTVRLAAILLSSHSLDLAGATRSGTSARVELLERMGGVTRSTGVSAAAVLYSVEFAITVIIAVLGLGIFFRTITFRTTMWLVAVLALLLALAIVFHATRRNRPGMRRVGSRLGDFLGEVRHGMRRTAAATLAALVGLALARRLILAMTSSLILDGIGNPLGFKAVLCLQSAALLVGFVSMIPLGLGTKDLATFFLYMRVGLPPEVAAAMAAIERVLWTVVPFVIGLVCAVVTGTRRRIGGSESRQRPRA